MSFVVVVLMVVVIMSRSWEGNNQFGGRVERRSEVDRQRERVARNATSARDVCVPKEKKTQGKVIFSGGGWES